MSVKTIIDLQQVRANQHRAAKRPVEGADFLFATVSEELELRLSAVLRSFERAAVFVPAIAPALPALPASVVERFDCPAGDDEALGLEPEAYDLAISLLTLHETNDTPGILAQIRRALRPDGLFMACVPGAGTLSELRESLIAAEAELTGAASARVLPFMDVRDAGGLLQRAGLALPVADTETLTVRYDTMFDVMRDLRTMGATNTLASRSRRPATRAFFSTAAGHYAENHADPDGRVRATFTLLWMSGWAPHGSQQQPLKPGSATHRLSDFLGDKSQGE